ncbi:MAG: hypothetical protein KJ732_06805 [Candidatus Margulisbacteria bacterium]|nr:hypothetical protein [Candidatus Margulisiibacteriota bacterium]
MNKLIIGLCGLILLSGVAFAGNVDFSANAGLYTAPGGIGTSTLYGVSATQGLTENLSVRAMIQSTTYTVAGASTTYTPISVDLIYGQRLPGGLYPYAGLGLSYNSTTSGGVTAQTTGAQAEVGVNYAFGPITAGVAYRYILPDLSNTSLNASAFNGSVTGSVFKSFSF